MWLTVEFMVRVDGEETAIAVQVWADSVDEARERLGHELSMWFEERYRQRIAGSAK